LRPVSRAQFGGTGPSANNDQGETIISETLAGGALLASGRGGDGCVCLGHQVGGLVQEHPRDPADQVRGLR
jgi:hypothetical protein